MKGIISCGLIGFFVFATTYKVGQPTTDVRSVEAIVSNGEMTMKKNECNRLLNRIKIIANQNNDTLAKIKTKR